MIKYIAFSLLLGCGGGTDVTYVPGPTPQQPKPTQPPARPPVDGKISFTRQVQPILTEHCALSGCHGSGGFLASEQAFLNSNGVRRIINGSMPPQYSPKFGEWTDDDKQLILAWHDQNF